MSRTSYAIALSIALVSAACVSEEVPPDDVGEATSALRRGDDLLNPRVEKADLVQAVQYGLSWSARRESNSWNWSWGNGSGRPGTSSDYNWYGNYGYCTSYSWGNRCNSSRDTWFITPGWGANFQNYWGQQSPAGWSTFGQHPYWCPNTGGTWQGWSSSGHC